MTPWQTYQQDLKRDDFVHDAAQENAVRHLQRLYDDLTQTKPKSTGFFANLFGKNEPEPIKGLYFWGGVGRGKTYLVDTFYEALPSDRKMRVHFHRFMHRVHDELKKLNNTANPLEKVADIFKSETDIICFDEFFVFLARGRCCIFTLFCAALHSLHGDRPGGHRGFCAKLHRRNSAQHIMPVQAGFANVFSDCRGLQVELRNRFQKLAVLYQETIVF